MAFEAARIDSQPPGWYANPSPLPSGKRGWMVKTREVRVVEAADEAPPALTRPWDPREASRIQEKQAGPERPIGHGLGAAIGKGKHKQAKPPS